MDPRFRCESQRLAWRRSSNPSRCDRRGFWLLRPIENAAAKNVAGQARGMCIGGGFSYSSPRLFVGTRTETDITRVSNRLSGIEASPKIVAKKNEKRDEINEQSFKIGAFIIYLDSVTLTLRRSGPNEV
jgi:hypothetical protein